MSKSKNIGSLIIYMIILFIALGVVFFNLDDNDGKYLTTNAIESELQWYKIPDTIDVKISEAVDMDEIVTTPSGETMTKEDLIVTIGKIGIYKPTGIRRVKCIDCHREENAGTGFVGHEMGGGAFQEIYNETHELVMGRETFIPVDKKPFKNRSNLNAFRIHISGRILSAGIPGEFVLEQQIDSALNVAHFGSDLILECQNDALMNYLSVAVFNRPIDLKVMKMSISAYQQRELTTRGNLANQYMRDDDVKMKHTRGFELMNDKNCNSACHGVGAMAKSRSSNPLLDTVLTPSLDQNIKDHPTYFHSGEFITQYKAIKTCDAALVNDWKPGDPESWKTPYSYLDILKIKSCINANLYDKKYTTK